MGHKGTIFGVAVLLAIAVALAYAGWKIRTLSESQFCFACSRPIHAQTRTVGLLEGKRELFCCPTCALTEHRQTGERVKITELTDFETQTRLAPESAVVVSDSDVNHCVREHTLMNQKEQASPMAFDRCVPSIIAFAHRKEAERFEKQHGGTLSSFEALASAYQR
jgi:hypothetical protein